MHCASLICAGRDYAALQVAETEPMLLESLNELIFPKIDGWRNFCAVNAIPCPPPFDNTQMELVRSLYTREISQTHPLYRDYRRAMRLKNFEGALAIIRTISKVNSANMEAKAECERLQKTVALEKFEAIKKALSNGDKTSAVKTALSIKDFADEYLYGEKIWDEVKSHIADYETAQAKERFAEILKELREIAGSGDSAKILALGAEYEIIANELGASRSRDGDDFVKSLVQKASASQKEKSEQEERAQACLELAAEIERP
ncbi:MAG: hypothetical protein J6P03_05780, partial [Opitutales bacterium]|nr:hypothetical protein [Opitutales bacterium]